MYLLRPQEKFSILRGKKPPDSADYVIWTNLWPWFGITHIFISMLVSTGSSESLPLQTNDILPQKLLEPFKANKEYSTESLIKSHYQLWASVGTQTTSTQPAIDAKFLPN